MAYQIVHKGVVREFDFHAPFAWPYWHERAFSEDGRLGLPLVVTLQGGGQDPHNFIETWDSYSASNTSGETNWQDRFFVLYPYGFDSNTGNDVTFIHAAVSAVEHMLQIKLDQIGITRPPIDPDRRYILGYSSF